ncbi:MAG: monofunctional biosynthetic peptidoglycan transglycosylase [Gemmatimonadota bacterium]|nr:MAG: monofunctional biosynthetic peptidoglycan transglycosylase [Gemmatimonadota bacterium]
MTDSTDKLEEAKEGHGHGPASKYRPWRRLSPLARRRLMQGAGAAVAATCFVTVVYQAIIWPNVARLGRTNPESTAFIDSYLARRDDSGKRARLLWTWVPYDSISPNLKRAVLVAEDINFFSHSGFEFAEVRLAIRDALAGNRDLRGASTISQQLAKNLWLSPSRNPLRKIKEALLTRQLERHLSKRRILEIYLNIAEFGPGVYGAEAAARYYFGMPAAELNELEAAQLAAALPRPARWNPLSDSESYRRYAARIVERMDKAQFLWRRI